MIEEKTQPRNSSAILAEERYLRERRNPSFRDKSYLALADLKEFVQRIAPKMNGRLLDYGCGGAPYRDLFANCPAYVRADMLQTPEIDLVLAPDGSTNEPDSTYDAIFSAQVLEHVPDPCGYVRECGRILKTGGLVLLSTHGLFLEHKCPNDYYRWTSQGLEELFRVHGFEILDSVKLTAGTRGTIQMLHYLVEQFRYQPPSITTFVLRAIRKLYNVIFVPTFNLCGKWLFEEAGVLKADETATIYIGVAVFAKKL